MCFRRGDLVSPSFKCSIVFLQETVALIRFPSSCLAASATRLQYSIAIAMYHGYDLTCKFFCPNSLLHLPIFTNHLSFPSSFNGPTILNILPDDNAGSVLWASVEPCTGILCACLPLLRPLSTNLRRPRFTSWLSGSSKDIVELSWEKYSHFPVTPFPAHKEGFQFIDSDSSVVFHGEIWILPKGKA